MERKVEQYIHFYIGCEVTHGGNKEGKLISVGQSGSIIVYPNGDQRGNFIMSEMLKPILRPLESMNEEDVRELSGYNNFATTREVVRFEKEKQCAALYYRWKPLQPVLATDDGYCYSSNAV